MTPPTPSTAESCSTAAPSMASSDPKARATARAPVGPTWRMPSATSRRLSGCVFEASIAATRLAAETAPKRSSSTSCSTRQVVEVGRVVDQSRRHQLQHPLLAQVFDVHGRTRRVVGDALHPLGRAVDVRAVGVALARQAHERLRHRPGTSSGTSTSACDGPARPDPRRTGPTTSGMTSPALRTIDQVARPDVLGRHLVLVVQRRHPDRRATDEDGLEAGEGRGPAGAADGDHDVEQPRGALLGRELEGDGPARGARGGPQHPVQGQLVHLGHHAVDLVGQVVALFGQLLAPGHHRRHAGDLAGVGADREAGLLQLGQRGRLRRGRPVALGRRALDHAHLVGPEVQRAQRGDPRILLAQRAGGRVARVDEEPLAQLGLPLVHRLELRHRHVDLAAHLEHLGVGAARLGQRRRHVLHRADVGGDVLAGDAVAPGRRLHQAAALVGQRHGHPVDLRLAREGQRRQVEVGILPAQPLGPRHELRLVERVVEAHHRDPVPHLGEEARRRGARPSASASRAWPARDGPLRAGAAPITSRSYSASGISGESSTW